MVSEGNNSHARCISSCPDLVGKANETDDKRDLPESQKSGLTVFSLRERSCSLSSLHLGDPNEWHFSCFGGKTSPLLSLYQ